MGKYHAEHYAAMQTVQLVGLADTNSSRAALLATSMVDAGHPHIFPFRHYRDLIGKVDAVSICSPSNTHYDIAIEMMNAGVDVFVEKPIATTVDAGGHMVKASIRNGRVLQVGHIEKFNPAVKLMGASSNSQWGPLHIRTRRLAPWTPRCKDVDVILDLMIHDINLAHGLIDSPVNTVFAVGSPDAVKAAVVFESGDMVEMEVDRNYRATVRQMHITTAEDCILLDFAAPAVSTYSLWAPELVHRAELGHGDALQDELDEFVKCIEDRAEPTVTGAQATKALETALMIKQAYEETL